MAFFDDPKEETKVEDNQTQPTAQEFELEGVKYSQAELSRLVGLGKIGAEAEEKFHTKIDRVWPEYTKVNQKVVELEAKLAEKEKAQIQEKVETKQQLSPDEMKSLARQQAKELGLLTTEDFDSYYVQRRSAEKLLEDVGGVVADAEKNDKPKTSVEAILHHMQETGIKNPVKAYNDLYEEQLDKWKEERMNKVRPSGFTTLSSSSAGSKEPKPINFKGMKEQDLAKLVSESLMGS